MGVTRRFLLWLFPDLSDELSALRSGNTKVVLENGLMHDRHGRMSARLRDLSRILSGLDGELQNGSEVDTALHRLVRVNDALDSILKDGEPSCG